MKFPILSAVCLLLAIITILAGCSSPSPAPGTGTPLPAPVPSAAGTPVPDPELSPFVLSPAEIPFVVMSEKTQIPDLQRDPSFIRFGAIRGYTRYVSNEAEESPASVKLGQMIVRYPPGNASLAFADFKERNQNAAESPYNVTVLPDPGIGEESCALTVIDRSGAAKPMAMIVFVKSDIMESVVMTAPSPDLEALTRAARLAAAKIP